MQADIFFPKSIRFGGANGSNWLTVKDEQGNKVVIFLDSPARSMEFVHQFVETSLNLAEYVT